METKKTQKENEKKPAFAGAAPLRPFGFSPAAALALVLLLAGLVPLAGAFMPNFDLLGIMPLDLFSQKLWGEPVASCADVKPSLDWLPLCVAALMLGIVFAVLAKMLGGYFGQKVDAWGKENLYQTAKSAIIVVAIFGAFAASQVVPAASFYGAGSIQIDNAISYAETVRNTMMMEMGTLTLMTATLSTVGNITPYFRLGGVGITMSLSPAFRPVFDALGILMSMMGVAIGEWFVHIWMLCFIKSRALALLLPLGLFLRAYGIHRAGDGLIALAIGLYFVYPFMMNASAFAMQQYLQVQFGDQNVIQSPDGQGFSSFSSCVSHSAKMSLGSAGCFFKVTFLGAANFVKSVVGDNPWGTLGVGALLQFLGGNAPGTLVVGFGAMYLLAIIQSATLYVLVVSLLLPLFNLFVTFTVVKELSAFMGTQLDFSAFEKLF